MGTPVHVWSTGSAMSGRQLGNDRQDTLLERATSCGRCGQPYRQQRLPVRLPVGFPGLLLCVLLHIFTGQLRQASRSSLSDLNRRIKAVRRFLIASMVAIAIVGTALLDVAPAASASETTKVTATQTASQPSMRAITYRISTPEGTLTYGWRPFPTGRIQSSAWPAATVAGEVPDSASGCNLNVCMSITGSGLHVDDWATTAKLGRRIDLHTIPMAAGQPARYHYSLRKWSMRRGRCVLLGLAG